MLELLKKIGLPATLAAVIASLVVMLPLAFTIDERYAKRTDLVESISRLEQRNSRLEHELAQSVGYTQAIVSLLKAGNIPSALRPSSSFDTLSTNIVDVGFISSIRNIFARDNKDEVAEKSVAIPQSPASAPKSPTFAPQEIEKPKTWEGLQEGLMRQQQRLITPQD